MAYTDPRYHTRRWKRLRAYVIQRDGRVCAIPGCTSDMSRSYMVHVDHIVPVKEGADFWNPLNLQVLCKPHHRAKTYTTQAESADLVSPNA